MNTKNIENLNETILVIKNYMHLHVKTASFSVTTLHDHRQASESMMLDERLTSAGNVGAAD